jgi:hypothetical protein
MSKQKKDNAMNLDPQRFQIAQSMSYMPGAPGTMMNNPMNVTSISPQPGSMEGVNRFPYGDSGLANDSRMGGGVFPMQPSGMPQNLVRGAGYNVAAAMTQQPTPSAADAMEAMRQGQTAMDKGLIGGPMGPQSAGEMATLPGGNGPTGQQTGAVLGLQGLPSTDGLMSPDAGQMVPGSSPVKNKKRGKK